MENSFQNRRKIYYVDKEFQKKFIIKFCLLASSIDASEIPSCFDAGENHSSGDVAVCEEIARCPDTNTIEQKSCESRLLLTEIEISGSRKESVEKLSRFCRFFF